jgi:cyclopropane fatty-acyl-phospholipid synthase-like methyltransferase
MTLSENQHAYVERLFAASDSRRSKRVLLQGWEQFDQPVDRIVSIGAFEHFGHERYGDFFAMAHNCLPDDGVMLLHTITGLTFPQMAERKIPLTFEAARFVKFIITEIFPGGRLPTIEKVGEGPHRQVSRWLAVSRCNSITPAPWTVGQSHWSRTAPERSPSSRKRCTTATCAI